MATFGLTAADVDTYAPGRGDFYSGDAVVAARVEVLIDRIGQEVLVKIRQQGWAIDEGDVTSDDELLSHAKAHVMYRVMAQLEAVASGQEASIVKFWMAEAEAAWGLLKTHTESLSEEYDKRYTRGTPRALKIGCGESLDTIGRRALGGPAGRRTGAKGRF